MAKGQQGVGKRRGHKKNWIINREMIYKIFIQNIIYKIFMDHIFLLNVYRKNIVINFGGNERVLGFKLF